MEKTTVKKIDDLVRMSERIGSNNSQHMEVQEFSILPSLKINQFLNNLNSGNLQNIEYLKVAELKVENHWVHSCSEGFLEGLKFEWSNGISTQIYAEGIKDDMNSNDIYGSFIRKIKVVYNENIIIQIQFLDKKDSQIGCLCGQIDEKLGKTNTKVIELQPGETIVGVNIQEIGYYCEKKSYEKQEGKDHDLTHIGSIQFQFMQLSQTLKDRIKYSELLDCISSQKIFDARNNLFSFNKDKSFNSQEQKSTGTWDVVIQDDTWILEIKWSNTNKTAKFEFNTLELDPKSEIKISFNYAQNLLSYKQSLEQEEKELFNLYPSCLYPSTHQIVKLTLKSHPGKAIVQQKSDKFLIENKEFGNYSIGEQKDACSFIFKKSTDGDEILITDDINRSMDCELKEDKYQQNCKIISLKKEKYSECLWIVNSDNSISPKRCYNLKWGIQEDGTLLLVDEKQTDKILIFKELSPTVDLSIPTLPLILSSPAEGKGIILTEKLSQERFGINQELKVGDAKNARKVFFDSNDNVRDSQFPFQVIQQYSLYNKNRRPLEYFTQGRSKMAMQNFYLTKEGSIESARSPDGQKLFLGLDKAHENIILVEESDPNKCIFKNASTYAETNKRVIETQQPDFEECCEE